MGGLVALLLGLIENLFGQWLNKKPDQTQEAEKAGAATAQLNDLEKENANVEQAAKAGDGADAAVASDDGLRAYEQSDPNNRDASSAPKG